MNGFSYLLFRHWPLRVVRRRHVQAAVCALSAALCSGSPCLAQNAPASTVRPAAGEAVSVRLNDATGEFRLESNGALRQQVLERLATAAGFTVEGGEAVDDRERLVLVKSGKPEALLEALLIGYDYSIAFAGDSPRVSTVIVLGKRSASTGDGAAQSAATPPRQEAVPNLEAPPVVPISPAATREPPPDVPAAAAAPVAPAFEDRRPAEAPRTLDQIFGTQVAPLQSPDRGGLGGLVRQATEGTGSAPPQAAGTPDLRDATQRAVQDLNKLLESMRAVEGSNLRK